MADELENIERLLDRLEDSAVKRKGPSRLWSRFVPEKHAVIEAIKCVIAERDELRAKVEAISK